MKRSKINKCLKKVAKNHGVSVAEVRKEIEFAIEVGMSNPDPNVKAQWALIQCTGEKPTLEELIIQLSEKAANQA